VRVIIEVAKEEEKELSAGMFWGPGSAQEKPQTGSILQ